MIDWRDRAFLLGRQKDINMKAVLRAVLDMVMARKGKSSKIRKQQGRTISK